MANAHASWMAMSIQQHDGRKGLVLFFSFAFWSDRRTTGVANRKYWSKLKDLLLMTKLSFEGESKLVQGEPSLGGPGVVRGT
jgi:hypothetical protein